MARFVETVTIQPGRVGEDCSVFHRTSARASASAATFSASWRSLSSRHAGRSANSKSSGNRSSKVAGPPAACIQPS